MNPDFIRKMRFFIIAILKSLTRNIKASCDNRSSESSIERMKI